MKPTTDFERLKKTLFCQEPDIVPIVKLLMDQEIKDAFMGRPVISLKDDVAFWQSAGYDFICLFPAKDMFEKSLPGMTSYTKMAVGAGNYECAEQSV